MRLATFKWFKTLKMPVTKMIKQFEVTLSTGKWFLLAETSMDAAYAALELSETRNSKLINVRIKDEWD